ncbi:hypothetical protein Bca4012_037548 [Brassica carinata]|uniref:Uncharacterized protein n=1 Tax=Brassica carinata TaxID=52824 RepID=A0A8X7WCK9_BRACI|nr:hypothetical protein Bca52824_011081 [Brassica carinata]
MLQISEAIFLSHEHSYQAFFFFFILHVAAYRGHADINEALISASQSLISARNNAGDTLLHSGFQTPAFERLYKHTELMNRLITYAASMTPYVSASPISCKLRLARGTKIMKFIARKLTDVVQGSLVKLLVDDDSLLLILLILFH